MFLDQELGLVQFLVGLKDTILNHFKCATSTFSRPEVFEDEFLLSFPVVIEGGVILVGRHDGVGNQCIL